MWLLPTGFWYPTLWGYICYCTYIWLLQIWKSALVCKFLLSIHAILPWECSVDLEVKCNLLQHDVSIHICMQVSSCRHTFCLILSEVCTRWYQTLHFCICHESFQYWIVQSVKPAKYSCCWIFIYVANCLESWACIDCITRVYSGSEDCETCIMVWRADGLK